RSPCMGESSSDDIYIPDAVYNSIAKVSSKDIYIWGNADYTLASNPWGTTYETVFYSNLCLEALNELSNLSNSTEREKRARGVALLFRYNDFLRGIWIWGKAYDENTANHDLGLVLKKNPDVNELSKRSTVQST